MPRSADVIAQSLYNAGVRHAFGVPGGEVLTLIDALGQAGITFILARHENAAGFMAEGAYHATGAPAVLIATVGPGMANTVNVTANAQQDRVPLIVLSGAVDEADALTYSHQVFDHRAVLRPLVKASFEAQENACDIMMDKAIRIALDPQAGPVHIDLPIRVASASHVERRIPQRAALSPTAPQGHAFERARQMFEHAEHPLIMAGLDVVNQPDAASSLRSFAERHSVPVITTYKAKGVLPEDHPLCLGGHGLSPKSDAIILPLIEESDLIICAGYDPIEMRTGWQNPWDPAKAIEFTAAPNTQAMHATRLSWVCDVGLALDALGRDISPRTVWAGGEPAQTRAALQAAFNAGSDWGPATALDVLNRMKPDDMICTVDSGAHRILMAQMWTCVAEHTLLQSTGLCTMGCALPLALGYKAASPERPVMAVMGDGCLDMVMGELATLRDCGLPVIVVVLVDGSLALIEKKQRASGLANCGVDFGITDYAALAEAIGLSAYRANDQETLTQAFAAALGADAPALIAIDIPARGYDGLI